LLSDNEAGLASKDACFRSGPGPDAIDETRHQITHGICRDAEEDCKFIVGVAIETELRGADIFSCKRRFRELCRPIAVQSAVSTWKVGDSAVPSQSQWMKLQVRSLTRFPVES